MTATTGSVLVQSVEKWSTIEMHLRFENVNEAFLCMVSDIHSGEIKTEAKASRNGGVLQICEPVIITYKNPRQRVLSNQARDCNCFGHLYEALWMLAGRNDVAPLDYYFGDRFSQYSDDGETLSGAYGYRWRQAEAGEYRIIDPGDFTHGETRADKRTDQLSVLIDHLKRKPESRRAVLHMSNVEDDLLKMDTTLDQCCNLDVCFSIENGDCSECKGKGKILVTDRISWEIECPKCKGFPHGTPRYLDMTVFNRSNDLILGALGANVVHFSFLQEYMACALGLEVGVYNQISNNMHVYEWNWKPEEWLKDAASEEYSYGDGATSGIHVTCPIPLVKDRETFDREVKEFVEFHRNSEQCFGRKILVYPNWREPFLHHVAQPMMQTFHCHKVREYENSYGWCDLIQAPDWQWVARKWIEKRQVKWEGKIKGEGVFDNA